MEIIRENIDNVNALLTIKVLKSDYDEKVEKSIREYKRKAKIDGFRPGMVPTGLVKKMYGKAILLDEVNKLVSDSLYNYINENKLKVLGDPLPKQDQAIDFDVQTDFDFVFEMGLMPEFELNLTKKDKLTYYEVIVDDKMIENYETSYASRFGEFTPADVSDAECVLKGTFEQLDEKGAVLEGGVKSEETMISLNFIKDEEEKKKFIGVRNGDGIVFNPKQVYPNDTDRASMLKISKEAAKEIDSDFRFTVSEVKRFGKAEINQDLFDKIYGKDIVKSAEEFREKIKEEIKKNLAYESDYKLRMDAREKLLKKYNMELPHEFLKRWLLATNSSKMTAEDVEKEFPSFEEGLRWQLIKEKIVEKGEIKVEANDVMDLAKEVALNQFRQYGITHVPDENLEGFAKQILENQTQRKNLVERKLEDKILDFIKESIKIETKEISAEEFDKLFENKN